MNGLVSTKKKMAYSTKIIKATETPSGEALSVQAVLPTRMAARVAAAACAPAGLNGTGWKAE